MNAELITAAIMVPPLVLVVAGMVCDAIAKRREAGRACDAIDLEEERRGRACAVLEILCGDFFRDLRGRVSPAQTTNLLALSCEIQRIRQGEDFDPGFLVHILSGLPGTDEAIAEIKAATESA